MPSGIPDVLSLLLTPAERRRMDEAGQLRAIAARLVERSRVALCRGAAAGELIARAERAKRNREIVVRHRRRMKKAGD